MKVYLDTVIVSALKRSHQSADEVAAIRSIVERFGRGELQLVRTRVVDDEVGRTPCDETRLGIQAWAELFSSVPFIDDTRLLGFQPGMAQPYPWMDGISNPLIEDEPEPRRLWDLGIERSDAHHIWLAVRDGCDVFLTCDKKTILKRREKVEREFPIKLLCPTELLKQLQGR